jgi:predicted  nucleic acid-binding Zn-ribbon protein
MRPLIEKLFAAQRALQSHAQGSANRRAIVDSLRGTVPEPILAHFLRLIGNGGHGVALVRHGVCSECHIRVPFGLVAALVKPTDVHLCDHCGCYFLLPEEEFPVPETPDVVAPQRRGRKSQKVLVV